MSSSSKLVLAAMFLLCLLGTNVATARKFTTKPTLAARLKLDKAEGSSTCWESLFQLQSCTSEVVLFFLNGQTYLGPGCCRAIKVIQKDCWPDMLGSLGYTAEEGDVLLGYCDASDSGDAVPKPPSPLVECVH